MNTTYPTTDEEYGQILDNYVIGCVDTLVVYKDKIILERRQKNPIEGEWWIFGGRMLIGESFEETAHRGLLRELGIDIPKERFENIGAFSLRWPTRREVDATNGCHHLLAAHMVVISDDEYEAINDFVSRNAINARWFSDKDLKLEKLLPELAAVIAKKFN
jgi:ADP-ribose pyrophosphatase YjhB (NUDIX family)